MEPIIRGVLRTLSIVNDYKPLTISAKRSILEFDRVLNTPLILLLNLWFHGKNFAKTSNGLKTVLLWCVALALLKVSLLHGCFSRFLNCTNDNKSRNATLIFTRVFRKIILTSYFKLKLRNTELKLGFLRFVY